MQNGAFWQRKTLSCIINVDAIKPYAFSPIAVMKNGYSVVNTGWRKPAFITKYFGNEPSQALLDLLDLHIEQQHAVQADGLLYFDFRVWFEPLHVACKKLQNYQTRMQQTADILHSMGGGIDSAELESCYSAPFVVKEFEMFLNPKTERCIGTPQQLAKCVYVCKLMEKFVPEQFHNKYSVFAAIWTCVDDATLVSNKRQAKLVVLQSIDAIHLRERALRVAGVNIAAYLDLPAQRRMARAFAGNFELVFAFSVNAIETELIGKLRLRGGKRELQAKLREHGYSEQLLKLLLNRAAECPERMLTIGTEAVKKELQARFEFSPQDHLVIEYCCTLLGGQEFREKKFAALREMEPALVDSYVQSAFVGTGDELVACFQMRQLLRRMHNNIDAMDVEYALLRQTMLEMAKTSNKSWQTIAKDVIKMHMVEYHKRSIVRI